MNWKATAVLGLFWSACALAQTVGGSAGISGTVKDPSGSVIPNAKVVISSTSLGNGAHHRDEQCRRLRRARFNPRIGISGFGDGGGFRAIRFERYHFCRLDRISICSVPLSVGQTSTSIDRGGRRASSWTTTKADVSTVVDNRQIQELPVNGRRVDSFVLLTPGVSNDATSA